MEYYSVIKYVVAATWMDLEGIMLSETNQTEKGKYMYVWLLHTSLVAHMVKRLPKMRETQVRSLGQEDPLEKEMATQSSILAWRIPWMEPSRLQSMGSQKVGHDWATSHYDYYIHGI